MEKKKLGPSGYLHVREGYDELEDPPVPEKPKWCEEHKPQSDVCSVHNLKWRELHDRELKEESGSEAVFYCPDVACDYFALDSGNTLIETSFRDYKVFKNSVRLTILFHKLGQREGDRK